MSRDYAARDVAPADADALVALGAATGLFSPDEADALLRSTLAGIADGSLGADDHVARVVDGNAAGEPRGWTYLARDANADGVWELMWIGVSRAAEGSGVGAALLADAERTALARGARMLLISTSSTPATARARSFYERHGYARVGLVPSFYAPGDDKVVYHRAL